MTDPPHPGVDCRPMFREPSMQADFARNGFVVSPLVDERGVARLASLWNEIRPETVEGIYSNVHDASTANNRRVDALFRELLEPRIADLFVDCYIAGTTYLVKGIGEGSDSKPHQDWNNVDERFATSIALWCPLVDVNDTNGALQVLSGSHRMFHQVRGITTPSVYLEFDDRLESLLTVVEVPAGTGVFYAHNIFHGSKSNNSTEDRVAAVSGVLPSDVQHVHYWQPQDAAPGVVRELAIDDEFFYSGLLDLYDGRIPASAIDRGERSLDTTPLTADEVIETMQAVRRGDGPSA